MFPTQVRGDYPLLTRCALSKRKAMNNQTLLTTKQARLDTGSYELYSQSCLEISCYVRERDATPEVIGLVNLFVVPTDEFALSQKKWREAYQ
eukprot:76323-Pyramimonas_sp.AAC.2